MMLIFKELERRIPEKRALEWAFWGNNGASKGKLKES